MTRSSTLHRIQSLIPSLSATDQRIAQFILDDPRAASRMTITEIASHLGLADSTVFKFTKKLGYGGFRDFRTALLREDFDPTVSIHEHVHPDDEPIVVAKKVFQSSAKSLDDTFDLLDAHDLERALDYLVHAKRISFYGCGESGVVALDSYQKFLRSPIHCHCVTDSHLQLMQASLLDENDVAFIITHTGLTHEMLLVSKLAREAGAKIILITSYPSREISNYADVTFISTSEETGYRSESLACRYAQFAIIDSLYTALMFRLEGAPDSLFKIREAINLIKNGSAALP